MSPPEPVNLCDTLWVNRSEPVNAYGMKRPVSPVIEKILPNIKPTAKPGV